MKYFYWKGVPSHLHYTTGASICCLSGVGTEHHAIQRAHHAAWFARSSDDAGGAVHLQQPAAECGHGEVLRGCCCCWSSWFSGARSAARGSREALPHRGGPRAGSGAAGGSHHTGWAHGPRSRRIAGSRLPVSASAVRDSGPHTAGSVYWYCVFWNNFSF